MSILTIRQAGHPNGFGYNTRPTLKTGGSFSYGPLFGTLGTGYIDSKIAAESTRFNNADYIYKASFATSGIVVGNGNEQPISFHGILSSCTIINRGSASFYINHNNSADAESFSGSGCLTLASGESITLYDTRNLTLLSDNNTSEDAYFDFIGISAYNNRTM